MDIKIIENFLPDKIFQNIYNTISNGEFVWQYCDGVAYLEQHRKENGLSEHDNNFMFTHTIYDHGMPTSGYYNDFFPDIEGCLYQKANIDIKAIIRIKCNLYTRTEKIIQHDMHEDYPFNHIAGLLSLNNNDGYTIFKDGTKIESIANRMIIFDGHDKHASTTCTNEKRRLNINFNLL